jgi:hypothetical protein
VYEIDFTNKDTQQVWGNFLAGMTIPGYGLYECSVNGCGAGGWALGAAGALPLVGVAGKVSKLARVGCEAEAAANAASGAANAGRAAYTAIGSTGRIGEAYLKGLGGRSQVYFLTTRGARYVDQLVNGVAYESKVGYVTMSPKVALQIAKDEELLVGQNITAAEWHFFTSPVTGQVGAAQSVLDMLKQAGIGVVYH